MTIIFLGTSNCIISGSFVEHVRSSTQETVLNLSMGASSSALGLYMLMEQRVRARDVVILDYAVTDHAFVRQGVRSPAQIARSLRSVVEMLRRRRCVVVAMINPVGDALVDQGIGERVHLDVCRRVGVPYLNVAELVRRAVHVGVAPERLMADPAHLHVVVMPIIGAFLVRAIAEAREAFRPIIEADRPVWHPRILPGRDLIPRGRLVRRRSSLRAATMASFNYPSLFRAQVDADEVMLGIVANMGASGAKVAVVGAQAVAISMELDWDNLNPRAFMSVMIESHLHVWGSAAGIRFDLLPEDAVICGPRMHFRRPIKECYGTVEIEAVLVARARRMSRRETPRQTCMDRPLGGAYWDEAVHRLMMVGRDPSACQTRAGMAERNHPIAVNCSGPAA